MSVATLHLICGLPCSGKTTLAKRLEAEKGAVRLSPDEWITRIYGPEVRGETLDGARDPVESALWELARRVLELGVDVILENGFWSRNERENYREQAAALGARSELHYTEASEEELFNRLRARNRVVPWGSFAIAEEDMRQWYAVFEPPTLDELAAREVERREEPGRP